MSAELPDAGQSFANGNSTQLQAPGPDTNPSHHPHPLGSAQRGRGTPRDRQGGSRSDERRHVISSTLRRGGGRGPTRAFGGSGNVLGGQTTGPAGPAGGDEEDDDEPDEDTELLRPLGDDAGGDGEGAGGGRVLGSAQTTA